MSCHWVGGFWRSSLHPSAFVCFCLWWAYRASITRKMDGLKNRKRGSRQCHVSWRGCRGWLQDLAASLLCLTCLSHLPPFLLWRKLPLPRIHNVTATLPKALSTSLQGLQQDSSEARLYLPPWTLASPSLPLTPGEALGVGWLSSVSLGVLCPRGCSCVFVFPPGANCFPGVKFEGSLASLL